MNVFINYMNLSIEFLRNNGESWIRLENCYPGTR